MPASPWEVADAEEEGVEIQFLVAPTRILGENGRVTGVECIRMQLGEPDASGRRRPIPIEGSEFVVEADTVIPAIGQAVEAEGLGIEVTRGGTLNFNPLTMETGIPGVFAAGDAATGPATVVEAIAQGKKAAMAIDLYLRGEKVEVPEPSWHVVSLEEVKSQFRSFPLDRRASPKPRHEVKKLPPEERISGFSEVELGFEEEKAIAEAERCLNCAVCCLCMECVRACQAKAINHSMPEQTFELEVGAIIVATGYDQFDARRKPELGYGRYPNVLSGLEFERLVSASGPTKGKVKINGKVPKEVVFIKCVGSRDKTVGHPYCSRVCCMYTAKQAHLIREKVPDAKVTVFYMDVRAFGKGFEEFYDRVREEGVVYRRGMVSEIYKRGDKLVVRAEDTLLGRPVEVEADLVVLATGLEPRSDSGKLAEILGIEKSEEGFFAEAQRELYPVESSRPGIFLAGCAQGPKDIPDAVAHAKAAAAAALVLLTKQTEGRR
jgi:heterodisulfide reductase subunit A